MAINNWGEGNKNKGSMEATISERIRSEMVEHDGI